MQKLRIKEMKAILDTTTVLEEKVQSLFKYQHLKLDVKTPAKLVTADPYGTAQAHEKEQSSLTM